jgi:GT2 family glycosyltransferase
MEPAGTSAPGHSGLVSIVIVHLKGVEMLRGCLTSVLLQTHRPLEVIVVDNGSTDGSIEMMRSDFPAVRIVRSERNLGYAGGNNLGVTVAKGEYVVLLNDDTVVAAQWLEELLRALDRPDVAVVCSKVITEGIPEAFYEMNGTLSYVGYNIMRHFADMTEVFFAGGASMAFRRSVVGIPFPEEYFLYQEDVHLSWRMRLLGYDVRMAPRSIVHHLGSITTRGQVSSLVTFYQERNRLLNCLLFMEAGTLMKLGPFFVVDALAKTLAALFGGRKSLEGVLASYAWIVRHPGWVQAARHRLQRERTVRDSEIVRLMSCDIVDGSRALRLVTMVNGAARMYAKIVGLPYHVADRPS